MANCCLQGSSSFNTQTVFSDQKISTDYKQKTPGQSTPKVTGEMAAILANDYKNAQSESIAYKNANNKDAHGLGVVTFAHSSSYSDLGTVKIDQSKHVSSDLKNGLTEEGEKFILETFSQKLGELKKDKDYFNKNYQPNPCLVYSSPDKKSSAKLYWSCHLKKNHDDPNAKKSVRLHLDPGALSSASLSKIFMIDEKIIEEKLNSAREEAKKEIKSEVNELASQKKELNEKIEKLTSQKKELQTQLEAAKGQLTSAETNSHQWREKLLSTQRNELQALQDKIKSLEAAITENENLAGDLREKAQRYDELKKELDLKAGELDANNRIKNQLITEKDALTEKTNKLEAKFNNINNSIDIVAKNGKRSYVLPAIISAIGVALTAAITTVGALAITEANKDKDRADDKIDSAENEQQTADAQVKEASNNLDNAKVATYETEGDRAGKLAEEEQAKQDSVDYINAQATLNNADADDETKAAAQNKIDEINNKYMKQADGKTPNFSREGLINSGKGTPCYDDAYSKGVEAAREAAIKNATDLLDTANHAKSTADDALNNAEMAKNTAIQSKNKGEIMLGVGIPGILVGTGFLSGLVIHHNKKINKAIEGNVKKIKMEEYDALQQTRDMQFPQFNGVTNKFRAMSNKVTGKV